MLFNSYIFLFLFLPMAIIVYFALNKYCHYRLALTYLLGMSLVFYGYFNYKYILIIIASILMNYVLTKLMMKERFKKEFLIIALVFNIGLIFYYKYYDFFISNVNALFDTGYSLKDIIMPLGISFFTIQQISYVVDVYKNKTEPIAFLDYAVYVCFFPQLVAGPIVRYDEMLPQISDIEKKRFSWDNFSKGLYRFTLGLAKKVLIADRFAIAANYGFNNYSTLNGINMLFAMFAYTIQIYFDFSGYSDMAIGLGKMFNFQFPENFDSPYKALTVQEFWGRWHLTLTRFLREYIYYPLGGNRKNRICTYINIMIVFLVSGLWHGASWTFILWGGCTV